MVLLISEFDLRITGKSTIMRSLLVAALLGNCGLFVPCRSAVIPRYDSFFLRTASHDIPMEGKSAFAVEMDDIRVMIRDSSSKSLVMIDEIGIEHTDTFYYIILYRLSP